MPQSLWDSDPSNAIIMVFPGLDLASSMAVDFWPQPRNILWPHGNSSQPGRQSGSELERQSADRARTIAGCQSSPKQTQEFLLQGNVGLGLLLGLTAVEHSQTPDCPDGESGTWIILIN